MRYDNNDNNNNNNNNDKEVQIIYTNKSQFRKSKSSLEVTT